MVAATESVFSMQRLKGLSTVFFLLGKLHVSTLIVIGDVITKRMQPSPLNLIQPDSGVKGA